MHAVSMYLETQQGCNHNEALHSVQHSAPTLTASTCCALATIIPPSHPGELDTGHIFAAPHTTRKCQDAVKQRALSNSQLAGRGNTQS